MGGVEGRPCRGVRGGDVVITTRCALYDQSGRSCRALWRWDHKTPLVVSLSLFAIGGLVRWEFARSVLACDPSAPLGDVCLIADPPDVLVTFYPWDPDRLMLLTGDLDAVRGFLRTTERAVPRCPCPERCAGCDECDAAAVALDGWLDATVGEAA